MGLTSLLYVKGDNTKVCLNFICICSEMCDSSWTVSTGIFELDVLQVGSLDSEYFICLGISAGHEQSV